jgi:hypothetical protein
VLWTTVVCTKGVHKLFAPIAGAPGSDSSLKNTYSLIQIRDLADTGLEIYTFGLLASPAWMLGT